MSPIIKQKWKRRCAVLRCSVTDLSLPQRKFSNFHSANRNREKRELWKDALGRVNSDGSPWSPKKNHVVCNDHFTTGMHSMSRYDTDYCPNIFPECDGEMIHVPPPLQKSTSSKKPANLEVINIDHGRYSREFYFYHIWYAVTKL